MLNVSHRTVARGIEDITENLHLQLKDKISNFESFHSHLMKVAMFQTQLNFLYLFKE